MNALGRAGHVGSYQRTVAVSLERMYENALDWEHLPFVHASSFSAIEAVDAGAWGWRARVWDAADRESLIELRLERDRQRWITRNIEGRAAGAEIWTSVVEVAPRRLDLAIDFYVPGIPEADRAKVGAAYAQAYTVLYDEDEPMMVERQWQLEQRIQSRPREAVMLPPVAELDLPHRFDFGGRPHVLRDHEGSLIAHAAVCPHQLAPLADARIERGEIVCPWHGYRFALASGHCTSGALCRMTPAPAVEETAAGVRIG
ncbi:MAG: Rieske (2Fe-2S) protein [Pseudomonadota bacterium]